MNDGCCYDEAEQKAEYREDDRFIDDWSPHFRYWHKADIELTPSNFRFWK